MQEINQKLTGQSTAHSTALYMCDVIAATEEYPPTKKSFGFYLCTCFSPICQHSVNPQHSYERHKRAATV